MVGLTSQLQSQISIDPWAMYPDSSNALSNNPKVWWSLCANVPHNGPPVLWAWIYGVILWFRVILVIGLFHKLEYASNIRLFWKCFWWTEMKQTKWCTFNSDLKSTFNTKNDEHSSEYIYIEPIMLNIFGRKHHMPLQTNARCSSKYYRSSWNGIFFVCA